VLRGEGIAGVSADFTGQVAGVRVNILFWLHNMWLARKLPVTSTSQSGIARASNRFGALASGMWELTPSGHVDLSGDD